MQQDRVAQLKSHNSRNTIFSSHTSHGEEMRDPPSIGNRFVRFAELSRSLTWLRPPFTRCKWKWTNASEDKQQRICGLGRGTVDAVGIACNGSVSRWNGTNEKKSCVNDSTKRLIIIIFCAGTRSVYHSAAVNSVSNELRMTISQSEGESTNAHTRNGTMWCLWHSATPKTELERRFSGFIFSSVAHKLISLQIKCEMHIRSIHGCHGVELAAWSACICRWRLKDIFVICWRAAIASSSFTFGSAASIAGSTSCTKEAQFPMSSLTRAPLALAFDFNF